MRNKIIAFLMVFFICAGTGFAVDSDWIWTGLIFASAGAIVFIVPRLVGGENENIDNAFAVGGISLMIPAAAFILAGLILPGGSKVAIAEEPVLKNVLLEVGHSHMFVGYRFQF